MEQFFYKKKPPLGFPDVCPLYATAIWLAYNDFSFNQILKDSTFINETLSDTYDASDPIYYEAKRCLFGLIKAGKLTSYGYISSNKEFDLVSSLSTDCPFISEGSLIDNKKEIERVHSLQSKGPIQIEKKWFIPEYANFESSCLDLVIPGCDISNPYAKVLRIYFKGNDLEHIFCSGPAPSQTELIIENVRGAGRKRGYDWDDIYAVAAGYLLERDFPQSKAEFINGLYESYSRLRGEKCTPSVDHLSRMLTKMWTIVKQVNYGEINFD